MTDAYADIGALLRKARKELRYSLEDASRLLHIRLRYLQALEEGRLEDLPGLPYMKGYLQTYAHFLRLDKVEILRRFEQVEQSLGNQGLYFPHIFNSEKKPNQWMVWGGVACALLAYGLWHLTLNPAKSPAPVVQEWPEPKIVVLPWTAAAQAACLKPQNVLYPPCHVTEEQLFDLLPLHSRDMESVMDLRMLPALDSRNNDE